MPGPGLPVLRSTREEQQAGGQPQLVFIAHEDDRVGHAGVAADAKSRSARGKTPKRARADARSINENHTPPCESHGLALAACECGGSAAFVVDRDFDFWSSVFGEPRHDRRDDRACAAATDL